MDQVQSYINGNNINISCKYSFHFFKRVNISSVLSMLIFGAFPNVTNKIVFGIKNALDAWHSWLKSFLKYLQISDKMF